MVAGAKPAASSVGDVGRLPPVQADLSALYACGVRDPSDHVGGPTTRGRRPLIETTPDSPPSDSSGSSQSLLSYAHLCRRRRQCRLARTPSGPPCPRPSCLCGLGRLRRKSVRGSMCMDGCSESDPAVGSRAEPCGTYPAVGWAGARRRRRARSKAAQPRPWRWPARRPSALKAPDRGASGAARV